MRDTWKGARGPEAPGDGSLPFGRGGALLPFLAVLFQAVPAAADAPQFSGIVATDFRVALEGDRTGDLVWNLNTAGLNLKQRISDHIRYELDLRVQFDGLSLAGQPHPLMDLTESRALDPFWLESDAAYVTIKDIFEGFDVVFGRQIVTWGASDRFRPTNNLNPDDLYDTLRFGMTQANEMIRLMYNPAGDLILEAVVVPAFRPARLPVSASAALADPNSPIPIVEADIAQQLADLQTAMTSLGYHFYTDVQAAPPSLALENVQVGARLSWRTETSDWSLSYYRGFDDFPHPVLSQAEIVPGRENCPADLPEGRTGCVNTAVRVAYPRMQAVGFDVAGQIGFLDDAGFRFEGAVVFPEEALFVVDNPDPFPDLSGHAVEDRPFFKATLGLDYTFTRDIFVLLMYVHGMTDEFGAHALGDYLVAGGDFKFFNQKLLLRVFGLVQLSADHPSISLLPMLQWNPWSSMEMELGALWLWGDDRSKFGQPAAGDTTLFFRSRVRF